MNKHEIFEICRRLYNKNLLASADGNVSIRGEDGLIWITSSGISKAFVCDTQINDSLACITIDGQTVSGRPSGERLMHLEVYKKCPDARAVIHAHPPTAIAWSLAKPYDKELPCEFIPEVLLATGGIPIVPYARPSTLEMGLKLHDYLPEYRVMILSRHGALTWGESLDEAYFAMERLEHSCQILKMAFELGAPRSMPAQEIRALKEMRAKIAPKIL